MNKRNANSPSDKVGMILILLFFLFGLLVLIPLFPPFGFFWCAILAGSMGSLRRKAKAKGNVSVRPHGHNPVSYSYDACAVEKRLEQLEVLRGAGLLDDTEYRSRREQILSMR